MDEEEDLELLRLAALKSLNIKKDTTIGSSNKTSAAPPQSLHGVPKGPPPSGATNNHIGQNRGGAGIHLPPSGMHLDAPIGHRNKSLYHQNYSPQLLDNYTGNHLEPPTSLEHGNVPYAVGPPSRHPPHIPLDYGRQPPPINNSYPPHPVPVVDAPLPIPNVQLSPRSAAFVYVSVNVCTYGVTYEY